VIDTVAEFLKIERGQVLYKEQPQKVSISANKKPYRCRAAEIFDVLGETTPRYGDKPRSYLK
jgi:hypothetical protein